MDKHEKLPRISRRGLLKTAGLSVGALVTQALVSGWDIRDLLAMDGPLKVGLLLPASRLAPSLAEKVTAGMQFAFQSAGRPIVELVREEIGFGPASLRDKLRQVVERDRVDLVVAYVNSRVAAGVGQYVRDHRVPFVASNAGANLPAGPRNPFLVHNTLNYWESNLTMGHWSAGRLGARAFLVGSQYESGYDAFNAFGAGLEAAGGHLVGRRVMAPEADLGALMTEIERADPDFVYAVYSGPAATQFLSAFNRSPLAGRIPLAGSGFMVEESLLAGQGDAALGVYSCFPWSAALESEENASFAAAYRELTGRPADPFALLGHDTARLVLEIAGAMRGLRLAEGMVGELVAGCRIASPRGEFHFDAASLRTISPLFIRQVQGSRGAAGNVVIEKLAPSAAPEKPVRVQSGWLNPYLCA